MKVYEKGRGDTSFRIETEYRLNEAGAKQYVLDQISKLEAVDNKLIFDSKTLSILGSIRTFTVFGLLTYFDVQDLFTELGRSQVLFLQRLLSPVEQI